MPAMIGTVLPGLLPANPWQALQTRAFCAPGESSGPVAALDGARVKAAMVTTNAMGRQFPIILSLSTFLELKIRSPNATYGSGSSRT
jgi:hypothetical protein